MISTGIVLIIIAIILGALAAHGLKTAGLPDDKIASFETGVRYQMYTGFGLLLLVGIQNFFNFSLKTPVILMLLGVLFFSGSIYLLSTKMLHGIDFGKLFPIITPIGGMLLISSWTLILIKYLFKK